MPASRELRSVGPAIIDGDTVVVDSNAILLYLAEKTGKFLPPAGDGSRGATRCASRPTGSPSSDLREHAAQAWPPG